MKLSAKKVEEQVEYWLWNAGEKMKTTEDLFKLKRYADCLFYGHLVIECLLKGLIAKRKQIQPPYSHNLAYLAKMAELKCDEEAMQWYAQVTTFNTEARYPEVKRNIYKQAKEDVKQFYLPILNKYQELCLLYKQGE